MPLDHLAHEAPKPLHERHLLYGAAPVLAGTRAAGLQPVRPVTLAPGMSVDSSGLLSLGPLDNNAEGNWTPVLRFGGATTGITYSTQSGSYTRVGRLVFLTCRLTLTSKGSATGQADIAGMPFSSISFGAMLAPYYANMVSGPWAAYISGAQIVLTVLSAGGIGVPDHTSFNNNSDIILTGHFQVS